MTDFAILQYLPLNSTGSVVQIALSACTSSSARFPRSFHGESAASYSSGRPSHPEAHPAAARPTGRRASSAAAPAAPGYTTAGSGRSCRAQSAANAPLQTSASPPGRARSCTASATTRLRSDTACAASPARGCGRAPTGCRSPILPPAALLSRRSPARPGPPPVAVQILKRI